MPEENQPYEERNKDDLLQEAQDRGIDDLSTSSRKDEVVKALREDDRAKLGAAGASDDEPTSCVKYVGPDGLIADALLPYQQDQAELENGKVYEAPVSVVRQLVLNANFQADDDIAENILEREKRRSEAGRLRAQRLLASPSASGETAEQFDQRVGISSDKNERAKAVGADRHLAKMEAPEHDPMAEFLDEEA
jgi:hypothetical protein